MIRGYFLVFSVLSSYQVAAEPPTYALLGQAANIDPNLRKQPDEILWKHNGDKVVEFTGMEQLEFGSYQGRVTLHWDSAEVEIRELSSDDSGLYVLEAFHRKHKFMETFKFTLQVIDRVQKPTITCEMNADASSEESAKTATLTCSAEPQQQSGSLLKFNWTSLGKQTQQIQHQHRPSLTIALGDERDREVYNCSVSNPLSEDSAAFTAGDCYPGISTGLVAGICCGVLIFILLGLLVLWILRSKGCFSRGNESDVEKQPSDSETGEAAESALLRFDRAPTLPSHQRLPSASHSDPRNRKSVHDGAAQGDGNAFMNELKQSIKRRNSAVPQALYRSPALSQKRRERMTGMQSSSLKTWLCSLLLIHPRPGTPRPLQQTLSTKRTAA
ncbi:uncharacterized protein LOC133445578 [Cololabis saira]|uniref:uncharacterized protein LOC133445578 n=1 Tax=Cololabis saira TaxID=129043 RepID=UPI002AD4B64F|nr:uncharacterized protein LOC133445578 [Cololabis saira]